MINTDDLINYDLIGYYPPLIQDVSVERAKKTSELLIKAKKSYCKAFKLAPKATEDGEESEETEEIGITNDQSFCDIKFRYRRIGYAIWNGWYTVPDDAYIEDKYMNRINYTTSDLGLSVDSSYVVEVGAFHKFFIEEQEFNGDYAITSVIITAKGVFMERDGEANSLSIGEAISENNTVSVGETITTHIKGRLQADSNIHCKGTITVGQEPTSASGTIEEGRLIFGGTNGSLTIETPYGSDGARTSLGLGYKTAGSISVGCFPEGVYEDGWRNREVSISLFGSGFNTEHTDYEQKGLTIGILGNRAVIKGLSDPEDPGDAVTLRLLKEWWGSLVISLDAIRDDITAIKTKIGMN